MTTDIVWQDPGPQYARRGRPSLYAEEAERIKAWPGNWARLCQRQTRVSCYSMVSKINARTAYRNLWGFEATTRTIDGRHYVYVRWPERGTE